MRRSGVAFSLLLALAPFAAWAQSEEATAPPAPSAEQLSPPEVAAEESPQETPLPAETTASIEPTGTPLPMAPTPVTGPWLPPTLDPSKKEWIMLTTGEWLRGNIDNIDDGTLYFDSAELDELEIDWPNIAELRSSHRNTYRFEGRIVVTGTAGMKDGVMRIDTGEGIREFPQKALVDYIEGELRERNYWSGKVSVGLSARSGNSEQNDLTGSASIKRETTLTRTKAEYVGALASSEGSETANNHRLYSGFDIYLTRRLFLTIPFIEFFNDRFSNIDLRLTPGVGLGYDILTRPKIKWDTVGGLAYQYTKFTSVAVGRSTTASDGAIVLQTTLELDPLNDLEWDTNFRAQIIATDFDKTNTHFETTLSFDIWGPLDLDVSFIWDYIVRPEPKGGDPTATPPIPPDQPLSSDVRLTVGLGLDW
jgi:putative salt-induced outer membrane protein YdiY